MRLPVCCCLLLLLVAGIGGQDVPTGPKTTTKPGEVIPKPPTAAPKPDVTSKKPTTKPQPAGPVADTPAEKPRPAQPAQPGGGDFDLGDALGGNAPTEKPRPAQPAQPGGGTFGDGDLGEVEWNHDNPGGHEDKSSGRALHPSAGDGQGQGGGENQSMVAGIVSTIAVAAVGAVSSFIAYQKKKLCFKGNAEDPENVNMESHKGDQSEPQVQSTLLAK